MSKYVNGITLLATGGVLLAFWLNHRIDQYLHPQFRPGAAVAGILLVAAGTIYCLATGAHRSCMPGECVHGRSDRPARSLAAFGIVVVPLVTGSVVSKDAFDRQAILNRSVEQQDASVLAGRAASRFSDPAGATAAQAPIPSAMLGADADETASKDDSTAPARNDGAAADPNAAGAGETADSDQFLPRAEDGNVALEVTDLIYGEAEPSLRQVFAGKTVEVVGQYLPNQGDAGFRLVRMLIVCCAADARPMMVDVESDRPVQQSDMAWVKVVGKPVYRDVKGKTHVTLKSTAVMPVDPPADAMLY